jgi:hypothetical protein
MGSGYQQVPDKHKPTGSCLQHLFLSITGAGVLKKKLQPFDKEICILPQIKMWRRNYLEKCVGESYWQSRDLSHHFFT